MIFAVKGIDGVYIEADNFTEIMYGLMSLTKQNAEVADWMEGTPDDALSTRESTSGWITITIL